MRNDRSSKLLAIVGLIIGGCAHPQPPRPATPVAPAVASSDTGHEAELGPVAIYDVCVSTDGRLTSFRAQRTVPGYEKMLEDHLRAMTFRPQPTPSCAPVRFVLANLGRSAADQAGSSSDGNAEPFALPPAPGSASGKPRNVTPHVFDAETIEHPMPHLPDAVKIQHANERLVFAAKVCAGAEGTINQISIVQGIPGADAAMVDAIQRWRIRPQPSGQGLCTMIRFEFTVGPSRH